MKQHITEVSSVEQERDLIEELQTGYFDIDVDSLNSLDLSEADFDECERLIENFGF